MNPQFHDEFVALSSLYFSGEISEEEWALLQIHMAYCDACHERFLQNQQIISNVIPVIAAVAATEQGDLMEESSSALDAAERRLMNELGASSFKQEPPARKRYRRLPKWTLAAVLAFVIAGLGTALFFGFRHGSERQEAQIIPSSHLSTQTGPTTSDKAASEALERAQEKIVALQQQLNTVEGRFERASEAAEGAQKQLEAEQAARKQINAEKDSLNEQLTAAQVEANSLRSKASSNGMDAGAQVLRVSELESKVRQLQASIEEKNAALSEKDRILALDKEFLAHDRDIRDMVGARNLYIADIVDTTENGRTAKQFGRIFYSEGRFLELYGFDLDSQVGHRQNASFQVWGRGSDRPAPVSLGLFYQDDTHKRWVLRCNDPKTLARLDMVFITVEPPGGSSKPTGKPLLRAYLQIQPNHP